MGEHQEADRLHPEVPRGTEMLDRHVGLGAVRRDPGDRRARLTRPPEVFHRAHSGQQQHCDLRGLRFFGRGPDEPDLVHRGEAVIEGRAAEAVAVRDLDDRHPRRVQGGDHLTNLMLGEPVPHRV